MKYYIPAGTRVWLWKQGHESIEVWTKNDVTLEDQDVEEWPADYGHGDVVTIYRFSIPPDNPWNMGNMTVNQWDVIKVED